MNNDRLIPSMPLDYKDYYKNKNIDELLKIKIKLEQDINKSSIPNEDIVGEGVKKKNFKEQLEYVKILIEYNEKYNNYSTEELKNMIKEMEELLKTKVQPNIDVLVDENKLDEDLELTYFIMKKIIKEKQNLDGKDKFSKRMIDSIISNHTTEFASKPPMYELPRFMFLFTYENQYYLVNFLSKYIMNYPNGNITNNTDTNKVLVFKIDDSTSSILNIDDFIINYDIKMNNENEINLDSFELPIKLNEIYLLFDEIFNDENSININKYNSEYLPRVIKYLSEDKKKIVINLPTKKEPAGLIRKYKTDGTEEVIELSIPKLNEKLPFTPEDAKYYLKISALLDIPVSKCKEYSRTVDNMEATFYYNPIRGGKTMIVSRDGSYLLTVSSAIGYDKLLEEFKTGKRNGNFENSSLFKVICHGCGKELEMDISKLPENLKTLDTMCTNCKSFVKFGNPNFKEQANISDFSKINDVKELENIIDNIFTGLTGDVKKDNDYLNKKMSEYKDHSLAKEISKEIGRKLYEIMPAESKNEISNAYNSDIENINKMLKEVSLYIFGKNKNLDKAKNILLDFVKGSSSFENDLATDYYNFNDVIDFVLYTRINKPTKDIKWLDIPFATAYSYLSYIYNEEKNYDEALKMVDQTIRWAPMSLGSLFEKCETYKMQKDWEEFNKLTFSLYDKIYDASDLAHYYRNLGYYYIEVNKLDIAYALYSASLKFEKHQHAMEEMNYINQQLGRDKYDMSADEGLKLMKEVNINFGPKQENLNMLTELYTSEKELLKNPSVESMLANRIYQFTKDKRFSPFIELIDKPTGCSIIVPRSWKPLSEEKRKAECGEQNMFTVYTDNGSIFQAYHEGKCTKEKFDEIYNLNVRNMIENNKKLNLQVLSEGSISLQLQQGNKDFKHALTEATSNGKKLRMIHYFTLINGIFADFSINVDPNVDYNDLDKFNNQKNMRDIINLLLNIIEIRDKSNTKTNPMDNLLNNIDNKIIELTNLEFEEIYINYQNNKNLSRANEYIDSIFKNTNVDDPFWITIAKNILLIIIVNIMEEKQKLIYDDFKTILSDKNLVFNICKNGISLKENAEYEKIKGNLNSSSDKIIESGYEILLETVGIIKPSNKQLVHKITFNNGLSFNITFDKELGELQHPNETTFRIGNNISILFAKCSSDELLEIRANEWLTNSAKTNKQVIEQKFDKKYSLKNEQINVIEKGVINENKKVRYYKFIYFNQSMIIFGYYNVDLSSIIDTAIESIKFVNNFVKVERNPFEKPNKQNNYLNRETLIKLNEEFKNKISSYDPFDIPNELYLDYFKKLEGVFAKHTYKVDKRFVTYGRLDFLRKELTERLNDKNLNNKNLDFKNQWDNRLGAFWDLSDYIIGDRHINVSSVPSGMNYLEIIKLNDEYYNEEIICEQEKDIILEMINEIKTFIITRIEKVDNVSTAGVKESLNMFKLKDREFIVKNSNMNINKMNDKYYIFPEINMEEKKYDGEYWRPQLYVNNGIEINPEVLKNNEIIFDYDASINGDECWTLYVFEHEDVLKSQIVLKRLDESLYNMTWNGTADVNWDDEFGSNVPFECECNISISNYDKYIN